MSWLITDQGVRFIEADTVSLEKSIPNGYYKLAASEFIGLFLEISKPEYVEKKIYGKSQEIANHILKAWNNLPLKNNLGVLFSGGKGLGKSLTTTLLAKEAIKNHPVIYVDTFYSGMADFFAKIKNAVIIIDEFEKVMRGAATRDEEGITKQETLLSVLDGTVGQNHNLYVLTCNEVDELDGNLLSRPGRIRYHYKFKSLSYEEIVSFCEDRLNDKEKIEEVASSLMSTRYVSHDILISLVDELNTFDCSVEEALDRLNIENTSAELGYDISINVDGYIVKSTGHRTFSLNSKDEAWYYFSWQEENSTNDNNPCVVDETFSLRIAMDFTKVRMKYFGDTDITEASKIRDCSNIETTKHTIKLINVVVRDPEASKYDTMKKVF